MILVEKHIIKPNHPFHTECDSLCYKSKNLYNQALYNIRQEYFQNKKYLSFKNNYHISKHQESYKQLPAKVSNQTLKLVDQNFKSFFGLLKTEGSIARIPKYLNIDSGRYITKFELQALGLREFKKTGELVLSQTQIRIKTQIKNWDVLKEVRIIPRIGYYVIEVVYEKIELVNINKNIASIDVGINNLATIAYNKKELRPFIINGKPLKSINQYYNKELAKAKSTLQHYINKEGEEVQYGKSNKTRRLTNKRNNKIADYLHKASRVLVNQLISDEVGILVIGKNTNQKKDSNMGKRNNQNFVGIPTFRFLDMVAYKARLLGIRIIWQEESYTSKGSFLNLDFIPTYKKGDDTEYEFSGYREHRGLYKVKGEKRYINADLNGAYNILRKAIPEAYVDGIEGFAVSPMIL